MICALVVCALLFGGGPRECSPEPGSMTIVDRAHVPADLRSCAAEFQRVKRQIDDGELPFPAGLRLVRFDLVLKPTPQSAEEPRP